MFIGLINMSSKAIGRKQERDYTFQSCEGPPDQPPLGRDSRQESLGSVCTPDSAASRQGSRWRGEEPATAFEDTREWGCVLATAAGRGWDMRAAVSLCSHRTFTFSPFSASKPTRPTVGQQGLRGGGDLVSCASRVFGG